ncbi:Calcium-binding component of the spindle pole body (SPB) half-bridge [Ciborinia camelliae]|nr:Calcium-binding component of the spindle pole body (SPB) half-bridge [Ciborinia camelliae]
MASASQPHSSFPARPYNNLRNPAPTAFGTQSQPALALRQKSQLERERVERERLSKDNQAQGQQPGASTAAPMNILSDEQREEINEAFGLFDNDKDQRIDYHEFKVALKALGFDLPKPEILTLLTTHGISPDAPPRPGARDPNIPPGRLLLTLPSFQSIASTLIAQRDPRDEILRAFALFDTDDKGMISLEDLRRVARELGEGLEEDELVAMIEDFMCIPHRHTIASRGKAGSTGVGFGLG